MASVVVNSAQYQLVENRLSQYDIYVPGVYRH